LEPAPSRARRRRRFFGATWRSFCGLHAAWAVQSRAFFRAQGPPEAARGRLHGPSTRCNAGRARGRQCSPKCGCRVTPAFPRALLSGATPVCGHRSWCVPGGPAWGSRGSMPSWCVCNVQGKYSEEISGVNIQSYPGQLRYQCFRGTTAGPRTVRLQKHLPVPKWRRGGR
jgi:hypothetical protein